VRLFVGTFLSESEKAKISRFHGEFGDTTRFSSKIAWVREEKLHQTWCFLGELDASKTPDIIAILEKARQSFHQVCRSFDSSKAGIAGGNDLDVKFDKLELWPRARGAKTLVISPTHVSTQFELLAQQIRDNLKEFCTPDEHKKRFKPHITIARFRHRTETPSELSGDPAARIKPVLTDFNALAELLPVGLEVTRFDLICSHLGSAKEAYESLHAFSL